MAYSGGDILEITYNHSVLGSGTIFCKAAEDGTIDLGGIRTADDENNVTGDGQMIQQMNRVLASFETPPIAWDMTNVDELSRLSALAASPVLGDWTISVVNGSIWGGKGKPVGDLKGNTNTGLVESIKLNFENQLKQIS